MQRTEILTATAVGFVLLAMSVSVAFAEAGSGGSGDGSDDVSIQLSVGATAQVGDTSNGVRGSDDSDANDDKGGLRGSTNASVSASATSSVSDDGPGHDLDDDNSGSTDDEGDDSDPGKGEEHRSLVADVVRSLLGLADRDGGIGEDIRVIAREQASSSEESADAMIAVESRSALLTFLFGSDYKNLGVLRSTLATTENHIERLSKAKERAVSADVKAGIDVQIAALAKAN